MFSILHFESAEYFIFNNLNQIDLSRLAGIKNIEGKKDIVNLCKPISIEAEKDRMFDANVLLNQNTNLCSCRLYIFYSQNIYLERFVTN